ncbi:hypothetical protein H6F47_20965 [Sphaerospermopsis sp. FACHB-1094]|jgi:hypothetical protein|uniref:Uncharacterized protein n=1 Tax=Anabaena sphaerica FACHB-251 TaxID=2692883 RepID=A0A926WLG9_9NOST|nr:MULTISPECIES: hypothetical protein [Nostocales]MBD2134827.1 hypothetical protein [Sphaerospermopsis sp. FACHB-1094]MBD2296838.1 hypothetical protein [Anabaena sphaerica FACHB-251]
MIGQPKFREMVTEDIPSLFDVRIATWHNDQGHNELAKLGITHAVNSKILVAKMPIDGLLVFSYR